MRSPQSLVAIVAPKNGTTVESALGILPEDARTSLHFFVLHVTRHDWHFIRFCRGRGFRTVLSERQSLEASADSLSLIRCPWDKYFRRIVTRIASPGYYVVKPIWINSSNQSKPTITITNYNHKPRDTESQHVPTLNPTVASKWETSSKVLANTFNYLPTPTFIIY